MPHTFCINDVLGTPASRWLSLWICIIQHKSVLFAFLADPLAYLPPRRRRSHGKKYAALGEAPAFPGKGFLTFTNRWMPSEAPIHRGVTFFL